MDKLYAPWRREYHLKKQNGCVFCNIINSTEYDNENNVFYRDEKCILIMNRFPYNPGHFMIIPTIHTKNYEELNDEDICHIAKISKKGCQILKDFGADGINMGWNLGFDAGAGIPEHIHLHLIPRFKRDTNMMSTIFNTRVYSANFDSIYEEIKILAKKYIN
jgi:diadenosine tetraphosphate (Ap4A) HIT family hydrolase